MQRQMMARRVCETEELRVAAVNFELMMAF